MPTLKANNILKRFGGLIAVNDLSFSVEKGEILGIIGPNGAGKTTVINLMAGTLQVNKGKIIFNDEDVTNNPAHIRNRKGISRTFQIVRPLEDFTAIENIMVGALFGKGDKLPEARKKAEEICEFLNITNVNKHVDELTVLELKKIELGRALAADPELLFLDEIMAGLNSEETWELIDIIKKLQKRDIAICLVEHIMKVVKELTQRVIVLDRGQIIAQGPYSKVSEKQEVIAAYLGEED
jgi:branched-chain amino acid transport system ATP-binding protein